MAELYQRYLPRMLHWASGRLPPQARSSLETGDLVQASVLNTIRRITTFEPRHGGAFPAYLRKTVLNLIRDEVRKLRTRPELTPLKGDEIASAPSPLDDAVGQDLFERYEKAFQRLHENDQALLFLKIEMDMSYEDIAVVTERSSPDAARMAARRAVIRLAEEMDHVVR